MTRLPRPSIDNQIEFIRITKVIHTDLGRDEVFGRRSNVPDRRYCPLYHSVHCQITFHLLHFGSCYHHIYTHINVIQEHRSCSIPTHRLKEIHRGCSKGRWWFRSQCAVVLERCWEILCLILRIWRRYHHGGMWRRLYDLWRSRSHFSYDWNLSQCLKDETVTRRLSTTSDLASRL